MTEVNLDRRRSEGREMGGGVEFESRKQAFVSPSRGSLLDQKRATTDYHFSTALPLLLATSRTVLQLLAKSLRSAELPLST